MQSKDLDNLPSEMDSQKKKANRQHLTDFFKKPLKAQEDNRPRWETMVNVFSFVGTTLVANPIIWPTIACKSWWLDKYKALKELHPKHLGECWIIFAYKNDNKVEKKRDYPIRTDGLVLPCRWCRGAEVGNGHDKRLPMSLLRLADRIKEQMAPLAEKENYLYKAEEFYLHLVEFPKANLDYLLEDICALVESGSEKDAVDQKGDVESGSEKDAADQKGDVESAWGALSTGLYFAMQNMAPPDVWPFSSVAYDAESKAVKPVGFLKGKLSVIADFNVKQFFVANKAQVKEAKILRKQLVQETKTRIRYDKKLQKGMDKKTDSQKIHYLEEEIKNLKEHLDGLRSIDPIDVKNSNELLKIVDDIAYGYEIRRRRRSVMYFLELVIVVLLGFCGWQTQWRKEAMARSHLNKAINLLESNYDEPQTDVAIHHLVQADILTESQQLFANLVYQRSWLVPVPYEETNVMEMVKKEDLLWKKGIDLPEEYPLAISIDLKREGIELVSCLKKEKDKECWRVQTGLDYMVHGMLSPNGLVFLLEGLAKGQNQIIAFNMLTGKQLWKHITNGNMVCGRFSTDSELFAYVNQGGHLHVLNVRKGGNEYEPVKIGNDAQCIRFAEDDAYVFTMGRSGKTQAYKLYHRFPAIHTIGESGYSSAVFDQNNNFIYRIHDTENKLEKLDSYTMRVVDSIEYEGNGKDLRLSDDGNFLILSSFYISESNMGLDIPDEMLKKIAAGQEVDFEALLKQITSDENKNAYRLYLFDLRTCFQNRDKKVIQVPFMPDSLEFMPGNTSCILAGESVKPKTLLRWDFSDNRLKPAYDILKEKNINGFAMEGDWIAVNDGSTVDILKMDGVKQISIPKDSNQFRYVFLTKNGFLIKVSKGFRQLSVYDVKTGKECWHLDGYTTIRENSRWGIPFAVYEDKMEIAVAVTDTSIQRFKLKTGEKIGEEKALNWVVSQIKYIHCIGGTALAVGGNDKLRGTDKKGYYALIDCQNMDILQNRHYANDEFVTFFGDDSNLFVLFDKQLIDIQNFLLVQNNKKAFSYLCKWLGGSVPTSNPPEATGLWHWMIIELSKKNTSERRISMHDSNTFSDALPDSLDKVPGNETSMVYLTWPQSDKLTKAKFTAFIKQMAYDECCRRNPELDKGQIEKEFATLSIMDLFISLKYSSICQYAVENEEQVLKGKFEDYPSNELFENIRLQIDFILGRNKPSEPKPAPKVSAVEKMQALKQKNSIDENELQEIIRPYLFEQLAAGKEDAYKVVFDILDKHDDVHDLDMLQKTKWLAILEEISMFEPFLPNGHWQVEKYLEKLAADLEGKSLNLPQYRNLFAYLQQYLIPLYLVDKNYDKAIKALAKLQEYGKDDFVLPLVFDLFDILIKAFDNQEHDIFRLFFEWMGKNNINNEIRKILLESMYQNVMDINRRAGATPESKKLQESFEELLKESGTMIVEVAPDSIAASFGWKMGDLIFDVDGIAGLNREQLEVVLAYFRRYKASETITIKLNRKGQFVSTRLDVAVLIQGLGIVY